MSPREAVRLPEEAIGASEARVLVENARDVARYLRGLFGVKGTTGAYDAWVSVSAIVDRLDEHARAIMQAEERRNSDEAEAG